MWRLTCFAQLSRPRAYGCWPGYAWPHRQCGCSRLQGRQIQAVDQRPDLVSRREVGDRRLAAQQPLVERVQRRKAARKQLAINHALANASGDAEADLLAQLIKADIELAS